MSDDAFRIANGLPWSLAPRALAFGVSWSDFRRAAHTATEAQPTSPDWSAFSKTLSSCADGLLNRARTSASPTSRRALALAAAAYFHFAEVRLPPGERKSLLQQGTRVAYAEAAPLLSTQARRVSFECGRGTIEGWRRDAENGCPLVVLVNGLDSATEVELSQFAELFIARGASVAYFDGPAQSRSVPAPSLPAFEEALAAWISGEADTHPERSVGLFGVSFGGYLACRIAAMLAGRLAACVSLGGFHDGAVLHRLPPLALELLHRLYATHQLQALVKLVSLAPLSGQIRCPLLIVHGSRDHLVDDLQIQRIVAWAAGAAEIQIWDDAEHVCTDRFTECLPQLSDWMLAKLNSRAALGETEADESCDE